MEDLIKYIAVDDSMLDVLVLQELARAYPQLKEIGTYNYPNDALQALQHLQPDIIFLDVEMPGMSGLEFLRQIKSKVPMAVFITSHPEFALDGFELSAFDYILKPITEERFAATMRRVTEYWQMMQQSKAWEVMIENETLTIKEGHNQVKLPMHDIIYLEAMQDYTKVVTPLKNYLTLTTLTNFVEKLPAKKFMRIHRSYAIALSKISSIQNQKLVCGGIEIPIGKTYRSLLSDLKI